MSCIRSARTLAYYLMETNLNLYHWLLAFIKQNPIPRVRTTLILLHSSCSSYSPVLMQCCLLPRCPQHSQLLDI